MIHFVSMALLGKLSKRETSVVSVSITFGGFSPWFSLPHMRRGQMWGRVHNGLAYATLRVEIASVTTSLKEKYQHDTKSPNSSFSQLQPTVTPGRMTKLAE